MTLVKLLQCVPNRAGCWRGSQSRLGGGRSSLCLQVRQQDQGMFWGWAGLQPCTGDASVPPATG